MDTLTIISVVVGVAGLVVGVVQLVLMLIETHKERKKTPLKLTTSGDFFSNKLARTG